MQSNVEIIRYTSENCLRKILEQSSQENVFQVLTTVKTNAFIFYLKQISAVRKVDSNIQCESFGGNLASRHIASLE